MLGIIVRMAITALGLWIASVVVDGIALTSAGSALWAALLLGIVNAIVRPVVVLLTLPITVVTLGLFLLVVNAAMLYLVSSFVGGLQVAGWGSAIMGSIIVSLTSWVASRYVNDSGRYEVMVIESRATHR